MKNPHYNLIRTSSQNCDTVVWVVKLDHPGNPNNSETAPLHDGTVDQLPYIAAPRFDSQVFSGIFSHFNKKIHQCSLDSPFAFHSERAPPNQHHNDHDIVTCQNPIVPRPHASPKKKLDNSQVDGWLFPLNRWSFPNGFSTHPQPTDLRHRRCVLGRMKRVWAAVQEEVGLLGPGSGMNDGDAATIWESTVKLWPFTSYMHL